jgi:hypothetical protein
MTSWCGGAKPITGTKMFVAGGGHTDGANNGMYQFEFAGTTRPTGWTLLKISPTSAVVNGLRVSYSDGLPSASHTADSTCMIGNVLYRLSEIPFNSNGGGDGLCYKFNLTTNTWTRLNATTPGSFGSVYPSPDGTKILYIDSISNFISYYFYRVATDTFSAQKSVRSGWPSSATVAYKPLTSTTGLYLTAGTGSQSGAFSGTVDWTAETLTQTAQPTVTAAAAYGYNPSIVYDAASDSFWMWGAGQGAASNQLSQINASTFAVTERRLTMADGASLPTYDEPYNGSFGRFVLMGSYRAIGYVTRTGGPAYVMRLP